MAVPQLSAPQQLGTKDSALAKQVWDSVRSAEFWSAAAFYRWVTRPVTQMSGWVRGCECHDAELRNRVQVACVWKGCRAPQLQARLGQFWSDLTEVRDEALWGQGVEWPAEAIRIATDMLASLQLKFAWVSEPPFTVWGITTPGAAQEFIQRHDEDMAGGQRIHRVSAYLAGPAEDSLRGEMLEYARTGQQTPRLRGELRAYQMCILDDTWCEAPHRNVSVADKRKTNASVVQRASGHRTAQNLELFHQVQGQQKRYFLRAMRNWRSIAQPQPRKASLLIPLLANL